MNVCKPVISIITVTYNAEKYLEQAIRSVMLQTYPNVEYIVVDGGSSDSTLSIIQKYEDKIASWISEPDSGIYNAMNKGITLARGEIIYFLGADDYLFDDKVLANIADNFVRFPDVEIICGCVMCIDDTHNYREISGKKFALESLKKGIMGPHQGLFVKREIMLKNPFDENYKIVADYDFLVKCYINKYRFFKIDTIVAYYRLGGKSERSWQMLSEKRAIIKAHFNKFDYYRFWGICCFEFSKEIVKRILIKIKLWRFLLAWRTRVEGNG